MEDWDNIQQMSLKDIKKMQSKKLRSFLKMVSKYNPYYRELFKKKDINVSKIKSIDDLEKIPFTTKSDMMRTQKAPKKPYSFVSEYQKKEFSISQTMLTGGTTADPIPIVYSEYDVDVLKETGKRLADIFNLNQENDVIVNAYPYKPHLAFWQTFHTTMQLGATALQSGGAKIMGTDKIITALEKLEATTFFTPPGYAFYSLGGAVVFERDIQYLETVVMGMNPVYLEYKERIKEVLNMAGANNPQVIGEYILSEAKHAWGECGDSTGYHTYPDVEILEVINSETGEQVPEGEKGEIVFTALDGGGTNLLRFKTGDLGSITYETCPVCERTIPRIKNVEKKSNYIVMEIPEGKKTVDLNMLYNVLMAHRGVVQWQLIIKKKDEHDVLELLISAMKGMDENEVIADLKEKIIKKTGVELDNITAMRLRNLLPRLGFETDYMEKRIIDSR